VEGRMSSNYKVGGGKVGGGKDEENTVRIDK